MKIINISEDLRNYIESLQDTIFCLEDLLSYVNKNDFNPDEFEISYDYFDTMLKEYKIMYKEALKEINILYKDEIENNKWKILFNQCKLVCFSTKEELKQIDKLFSERYFESYTDRLQRLYGCKDFTPTTSSVNNRINDGNCKEITFQVTEQCSMNCSYCYQHNKTSNNMSFDVGKQLIDMILNDDEKITSYITGTKINGCVLNFIGGEPLLQIELIDKLTRYFFNQAFKKKHLLAIRCKVGICSNGLLHFNPKVQKYLKENEKHLSYTISIDGSKEVHDRCRIDKNGNPTFNKCISALKDFNNNFYGMVGNKITLSPDNMDYLTESVKTFVDLGYYDIHMNCVYEDVWSKSDATKLYFQLKNLSDYLIQNHPKVKVSILTYPCGYPKSDQDVENWCGGIGSMLALDWKGNFFPCLRYMESSLNGKQKPYTIGNIKDGINILQEDKEKLKCLSTITRQTVEDNECSTCKIATGCGWCNAFAYENYGTPKARTKFHCELHKARSLAIAYYYNKQNIYFPIFCPKDWAIPIIGEEEFYNLQQMAKSNKEGMPNELYYTIANN